VFGDPVNSSDLGGAGCPKPLRKAASLFGWLFGLSAANRLSRGDFSGAGRALLGGWDTGEIGVNRWVLGGIAGRALDNGTVLTAYVRRFAQGGAALFARIGATL
jgi:hypothetical protein